jgi:hypothetical protein
MEEALILYNQGVRLILDLRTQVAFGGVSATKAALLEQNIIPLFLRLGTISLTISGVQPSELFAVAEKETGASRFTSISSARTAITVLATEVMLFDREARVHLDTVGGGAFVSQDMLTKKQCFQAQLDDWLRAYNCLCESISAESSSSLTFEPVLLTYHAATSISLSGCLTSSETVYDAHIADFVTIVQHADLVLSASAGPDGSQPPFTFEMGVGIPLFLTSMKCRETSLRHRALQLLRQAPPMQGFFKCTPVALLAGNLMRLEEGYASMIQEATREQLAFDYSTSIAGAQSIQSMAGFIPEEARLSFCGVFRPANGFPPGIAETDVVRWGRGPDQLFLHYSKKSFDATSGIWQQVSEIVPLEA